MGDIGIGLTGFMGLIGIGLTGFMGLISPMPIGSVPMGGVAGPSAGPGSAPVEPGALMSGLKFGDDLPYWS